MGYMIIQCVLVFLVNDYVSIDTYIIDPSENDMFTKSNKAFTNLNYF